MIIVMEACNKTIGSMADMLPNRKTETIIEVLITNNFKITYNSKAEEKINKYIENLPEDDLIIGYNDVQDAKIIN